MPDQEKLRVGSVCSGVGGFELGLHRADSRFDLQWLCEKIEQRRTILRRHWPEVPIHDDITELDPDALEPIDLLVGGTPCQDLSVAGKRGGLEGERSGLFWHFIRLRNSLVPRWTVWENVPGALSSNDGMDFALVLGAFVGAQCHVPADGWGRSGVAAGPWGGCVWRTLNSQHFGVPQRRHRVFVVGRLGGMVPTEVLLERRGGEGNPAPRQQTRPRAPGDAGSEPKGAGSVGTPGGVAQSLTTRFGNSGPDLPDAEGGWLVSDQPDVAEPLLQGGESSYRIGAEEAANGFLQVAPALTKRYHKGVPSDGDDAVVLEAPDTAAPLTRGSAASKGVSEPGRRQEDDVNLVAAQGFDGTQDTTIHDELSPTGGEGTAAPMVFEEKTQVRRLTPTECERLQGFPDGWTMLKGSSMIEAPSHYQLAPEPPPWELEPTTFEWQAGGNSDESWRGGPRSWICDKPGTARALGTTKVPAVFTKRHAASHDDDYESWEEADEARTLVDGRLNAMLAVDGVIHADAVGRDGEAKTPSPDAEGNVRLRDAGLGITDDDQSYNLTTGKPHAVSIRTAQQGANGLGITDEFAPTIDETGAGAVAHALTAEGFDASEDGTGRGTPLVPDVHPTLRSNPRNNSNPSTQADMLVASVPVGSSCPFDPPPDAHRYAAMGDAVTVPVISFIGSRIAAIEDGKDPDA